jgi:3-hydroxyacyl-[acyl-carrier protein] dehydratase/trans-2-decenoyl-[acyl-carrier protein] isomerase
MDYKEFLTRTYLSKQELLALSHNNLLSDLEHDIPSLPAPPFLMLDRVVSVERQGVKGKILAEKDILIDEWFFQCHFRNDPVMPGCLGVDAIWQLMGLYCALRGAIGSGRALGCGEVEFLGQIRPHNKVIKIEVDIRRYSQMESQKVSISLGDGRLYVDNELIYKVKDARVGIFDKIRYTNYPMSGENDTGGIMKRN